MKNDDTLRKIITSIKNNNNKADDLCTDTRANYFIGALVPMVMLSVTFIIATFIY